MQDNQALTGMLLRDMDLLRPLLIGFGFYDDYSWLEAAIRSSQDCASLEGHDALKRVAARVRNFGYSRVAEWIETDVLRTEAVAG